MLKFGDPIKYCRSRVSKWSLKLDTWSRFVGLRKVDWVSKNGHLTLPHRHPPPAYSVCLSTTLDKFDLVDVAKVAAAIRTSPSKQCQLDSLPTWLLKDCITSITHIINSSITAGCFPTPWKHAIVSPLLKTSVLDKSVPANYRPVSNLTFLSKLLERALHRQIIDYLLKHKLLPEFQSAYRRSYWTETAVLKVFSDTIDAIDKGHLALLSLLDLLDAFDTVDHSILSERLERSSE